jgi:hypothetical protein
MEGNIPRPLSELKFWEKGGRTPSKMVFFLRSAACQRKIIHLQKGFGENL